MSNDDFCMSNRLNFGLRTSAVALFPRQATPGGASSRIRSCHPRAVLFSPKASGIFQPSGKRRTSAALGRAGMGCSAEGAGQRHNLSDIFLSGIRKTRTLYAEWRIRFPTISLALCLFPFSVLPRSYGASVEALAKPSEISTRRTRHQRALRFFESLRRGFARASVG
jgi:hypothetical protein